MTLLIYFSGKRKDTMNSFSHCTPGFGCGGAHCLKQKGLAKGDKKVQTALYIFAIIFIPKAFRFLISESSEIVKRGGGGGMASLAA